MWISRISRISRLDWYFYWRALCAAALFVAAVLGNSLFGDSLTRGWSVRWPSGAGPWCSWLDRFKSFSAFKPFEASLYNRNQLNKDQNQ
ncbi:hypothetical protein GGR58DRAFT_484705 [Xylaria digitata]|nr:hypothetical protein GGR58DRAFT_484705 [Xylaria digitata]